MGREESYLDDDYYVAFTRTHRIIVKLTEKEKQEFFERERTSKNGEIFDFEKELQEKYGEFIGERFYCHLPEEFVESEEVIEDLKEVPPMPSIGGYGKNDKYLVIFGEKKILCKRLCEYEIMMLRNFDHDLEEMMWYLFNMYGLNDCGLIRGYTFMPKPPKMEFVDCDKRVLDNYGIAQNTPRETYFVEPDRAPDWLVIYTTSKKAVRIKMTKKMKDLYTNRYRCRYRDQHPHEAKNGYFDKNTTWGMEYDGETYFAEDYAKLLGLEMIRYEFLYDDVETVRIGCERPFPL